MREHASARVPEPMQRPRKQENADPCSAEVPRQNQIAFFIGTSVSPLSRDKEGQKATVDRTAAQRTFWPVVFSAADSPPDCQDCKNTGVWKMDEQTRATRSKPRADQISCKLLGLSWERKIIGVEKNESVP